MQKGKKDYYKMKNVESDTDMRSSIAESDKDKETDDGKHS